MSFVTSRRRLTLAAAAAIAAVAATAGPAMAGGTATGCPDASVSQPFASWGDGADYQLAPHGDVEDAAESWSLEGGARAVEGNEPFMASGSSDHLSLRLPGSSSATTQRMCIGPEHPSFRFFAKRSGGSAEGHQKVEVVFDGEHGRQHSLPVGLVSSSGDWAPSQSLPTVVDKLAAARGTGVNASFRFAPQGGGVWSVDDVFVDPFRGIR